MAISFTEARKQKERSERDAANKAAQDRLRRENPAVAANLTGAKPLTPTSSPNFAGILDPSGLGTRKDPLLAESVVLNGERISIAERDRRFEEQQAGRTPQQKAEDLLLGNIAEDAAFKDELLGTKTKAPTSIEQAVNDQLDLEGQARDVTTQETLNAQAEAEERQRLASAGRAEAANIAGIKQALPTNREGIVSTGNEAAISRFQQESRKRIDVMGQRLSINNQLRTDAVANLKKAQIEGNEATVRQFQIALDQAENEVRRSETDYINALDVDDQRKRANLESLQGLINTGIELTPDQLQSQASNLGLPLDMVQTYYQAGQSIRDDKSIDDAQKEIELLQLDNQFEQAQRGIFDENLRKRDEINNLDIPQDQKEDLFELFGLGISDFTKASREREAILQEIDILSASGRPPVGSREDLILRGLESDLAIQDFEIAELRGDATGSATVGIENIKTNQDGTSNGSPERLNPVDVMGGYSIDETIKTKSKDRGSLLDENGEVIARITTLPFDSVDVSGEAQHNGLDLVFPEGNVKSLSGGTIVKADVALDSYGGFVWIADDAGNIYQYGHLDVDDVKALEVGQSFAKGEVFAKHETNANLDGVALGAHTDLRFIGKGEEVDQTILDKFVQNAVDSGLSGQEAVKVAKERLADSFKDMTESESKSFNAHQIVSSENKIYDDLIEGLDLESFANQINVISQKIKNPEKPLTAEFINRNIKDSTTRQAILSEMRWIEAKLRKESGAAISVGEYLTNGLAFFPRAGDDIATINAKAQQRKLVEENFFNTMGSSGQRIVFEEERGKEKEVEQAVQVEEAKEQALVDQHTQTPEDVVGSSLGADFLSEGQQNLPPLTFFDEIQGKIETVI